MRYNSTLFDPPCPALEVEVEPPISTGTMTKIVAQIDTGGDYCVIPKRIIEQLKLVPYRLNRFESHDGNEDSMEVYRIKVTISDLPVLTLDTIYLPFVDREDYMVFGREGLNKLRLFLDGPSLEFEFYI